MTSSDPSDQTRQTYDEHAAVIAERFWRSQLHRAWETFLGALPPQSKIADIGCGAGRDVWQFLENGHTVLGVDYSAGLLAEAAKRMQGTFVQADMRSLPLAPNYFDGAWLSASLLHLPKKEVPGVLAGVYACLKTGGVVYISVKVGQGEEWENREGPRFFSYFENEEISQMVTQAGFSLYQNWQEQTPKLTWANLLAVKV